MMAPANQYPQIVYSSTAFICVWLRAAVETLGHFKQLLRAEKDAWMQEPLLHCSRSSCVSDVQPFEE